MLQQERQQVILNQVSQHKKVTTTELCSLLKVSLDTVRRDLHQLELNGHIIKVHGGAISKTFHVPYQQPKVYAKNEKKIIARKALELINDGMIMIWGGGTIILELARIIPKDLKGTIFTVSPLVALEVAQRSKINVILLGGRVTPGSYICTGSPVISQLNEIKADLSLISANGISVKYGITEDDWEVAQVKKSILKAADKKIILSIAENMDKRLQMKLTSVEDADFLITELEAKDRKLAAYRKLIKLR